jgi:Protein of unknown function (DUF3604)
MFRQAGSFIKFGMVAMLAVIPLTVWLTSNRSMSDRLQNSPQGEPQETVRTRDYSPYVGRRYPISVYWGETHLHTSVSPDAGLVGDRLALKTRFASPEASRSSLRVASS